MYSASAADAGAVRLVIDRDKVWVIPVKKLHVTLYIVARAVKSYCPSNGRSIGKACALSQKPVAVYAFA